MTKPTSAKPAKAKSPKSWRATVNLDRLDAKTGQWLITTSKARDNLPRAVATDPAVRAAVVAWMDAHKTKQQPGADESAMLAETIRTSVTAAFRALPPAEVNLAAAVASK